MHTTTLPEGNPAHHNGDFSGDVKFSFIKTERDRVIEDHANGEFTVTLPMEWLEYLVGVKITQDLISKMEQTDPLDLVRAK